jgi:hypothetical protein
VTVSVSEPDNLDQDSVRSVIQILEGINDPQKIFGVHAGCSLWWLMLLQELRNPSRSLGRIVFHFTIRKVDFSPSLL